MYIQYRHLGVLESCYSFMEFKYLKKAVSRPYRLSAETADTHHRLVKQCDNPTCLIPV